MDILGTHPVDVLRGLQTMVTVVSASSDTVTGYLSSEYMVASGHT